MNSKTLKRELIVAVVMVLVAAIALSGSTYAWFTMNSKVSATGLEMKAATQGNILIAKSDDGVTQPTDSKYGTTTDLSTDEAGNAYGVTGLNPGSTVDLEAWSTAIASAPGAYTAKTGTYTEGVANTNYVVRNVFIKSVDTDANIYVEKIEVSGDVTLGNNVEANVGYFYDSIRVGVMYADGKYVVYAPDTTGAADGRAYDLETTTVSAVPANNFAGCTNTLSGGVYTCVPASADSDNYCEELKAATPEVVKLYIWFEGEDATCYTNNIDLEDVSIAIHWTVKAPAPAPEETE